MTEHALKVWPEFFDAIESGEKTWEFRRDDRGFRVGDVLELKLWDPNRFPNGAAGGGGRGGYVWPDGIYTGIKRLRVRVTYILHGGRLGVPEGFCIMSIEKETTE